MPHRVQSRDLFSFFHDPDIIEANDTNMVDPDPSHKLGVLFYFASKLRVLFVLLTLFQFKDP